MQKNEFKSEMALHKETLETLSERMDIHITSLSRKMNGYSDFRTDELKFLKAHWNLSPEKFWDIFFTDEEVD